MRSDAGFVLIHRKINTCAIGRDGIACMIFVKLITWANWREGRLNGETVDIGEVITGIDELARETGFGRSSIHRKLVLMEQLKMISRSVGQKRTKITIVNYRKHQAHLSSHETGLGQGWDEPGTRLGPSEEFNNKTKEQVKGEASPAKMIAHEKFLERKAAKIRCEIIGAVRAQAETLEDHESNAKTSITEPGWSIVIRKYRTWESFCREYARDFHRGFSGAFEASLQKIIEGYLADDFQNAI